MKKLEKRLTSSNASPSLSRLTRAHSKLPNLIFSPERTISNKVYVFGRIRWTANFWFLRPQVVCIFVSTPSVPVKRFNMVAFHDSFPSETDIEVQPLDTRLVFNFIFKTLSWELKNNNNHMPTVTLMSCQEALRQLLVEQIPTFQEDVQVYTWSWPGPTTSLWPQLRLVDPGMTCHRVRHRVREKDHRCDTRAMRDSARKRFRTLS